MSSHIQPPYGKMSGAKTTILLNAENFWYYTTLHDRYQQAGLRGQEIPEDFPSNGWFATTSSAQGESVFSSRVPENRPASVKTRQSDKIHNHWSDLLISATDIIFSSHF
jgi:hypothetical protein